MEEKENLSLFERYHNDIAEKIKVNEFNMKEVQMDLPNLRHYWVGRLMFHKFEIVKLRKTRKIAAAQISQQTLDNSPVSLTVRAIEDVTNNHDIIRKIDENIAENELLVEYLTKVESNFRNIGFDIKNLIEIVKLETT